MQVKIDRHGVIHYIAQCTSCEWDDGHGGSRTQDAVRMATKRHVAKTGHTVHVETGTVTYYRPDNA